MPFLFSLAFSALFATSVAFANPYPNKDLVPKDGPHKPLSGALTEKYDHATVDVLRVQIDWDPATGQYSFGGLTREPSGTAAFLRRAGVKDPLGSFKAQLTLAGEKEPRYFDSIGTGEEYKRLTRAITFRFPDLKTKALFEMFAENPVSGVIEKVVERELDPAVARLLPRLGSDNLQVKLLKAAEGDKKLLVNIYADGYLAGSADKFWRDAHKVIDAIGVGEPEFPFYKQLEIRAVFAPSKVKLGEAKDLGMPVAERDSYLGLYYPYWRNFGRWYNVVYPTREARFRDGLAQVPYDYPIVLLDNKEYFGVGNYKVLTAIPSDDDHFNYLLRHEFGHFFGLNEEYEGGGPTELQFAPGINEPWSQNITFLREPSHAALKWHAHVKETTPLPTPDSMWMTAGLGAYVGGYGDSLPEGASHKPGRRCVMERFAWFCPVCLDGIVEVIKRDLQ